MPNKAPARNSTRKGRTPSSRTASKNGKPARRRLSPEARRAELMKAALAVFARRGLGEARHAEIAADAGVSVPTVFFYFPTREVLVDAVLDEVERFLLDMGTSIHAGRGPADAVLLEHLRTFAASVDSSPSHARIWLDWSTAVRDAVWKRYLVFIDRMIGTVRSTLERGQREGTIARTSQPDDQARLLVGSAHMLALMKFSGAPEDRLEHFLATLMEAVIGPPAAGPAKAGRKRSR